MKRKRVELEATRESIVRRMQQLHAQVSVRRKEGRRKIFFYCPKLLILERDLWKQKYIAEKKKTTALEESTQTTSVQI